MRRARAGLLLGLLTAVLWGWLLWPAAEVPVEVAPADGEVEGGEVEAGEPEAAERVARTGAPVPGASVVMEPVVLSPEVGDASHPVFSENGQLLAIWQSHPDRGPVTVARRDERGWAGYGSGGWPAWATTPTVGDAGDEVFAVDGLLFRRFRGATRDLPGGDTPGIAVRPVFRDHYLYWYGVDGDEVTLYEKVGSDTHAIRGGLQLPFSAAPAVAGDLAAVLDRWGRVLLVDLVTGDEAALETGLLEPDDPALVVTPDGEVRLAVVGRVGGGEPYRSAWVLDGVRDLLDPVFRGITGVEVQQVSPGGLRRTKLSGLALQRAKACLYRMRRAEAAEAASEPVVQTGWLVLVRDRDGVRSFEWITPHYLKGNHRTWYASDCLSGVRP